ncbi:MAG: PAS domain-containing protein [Dehalococcoidia bacterium]
MAAATVDTARTVLDCDSATLRAVEADGSPTLQAVRGLDPALVSPSSARPITDIAIRENRTVTLAEVADRPELTVIARAAGLRAAAAVPCRAHGQVVATLNVGYRTRDRIDDHDLRLMRFMATAVGVAVARVQAAERERAALRRLQALDRFMDATIALLDDTDAILQALVNRVAEAFDVDTVSARMLDDARTALYVRAAHGIPPAYWRPAPTDDARSLMAQALGSLRSTQEAGAPAVMSPLNPYMRALGIQSALAAPMRAGRRGIGVLTVARRQRRAFAPAESRLREMAADRAATLIEAVRLRDGLRQAVRLQHQSLALLEAQMRGSPVGYAYLDTDLRFVHINQMLADLNGVPVERHVGRTPTEVFAEYRPDALHGGQMIERLARQVLASGAAVAGLEFQSAHPLRKGVEGHWLLDFYPVRAPGHGSIIGVGASVTDITAQKHTERTLHEAEARYRTLVEQMPAVTYIASATRAGETLYYSPQVEQALGYPPDAFYDDPDLWPRLVHPADRERVFAALHQCRDGGAPFDGEYRTTHPDGRVRWWRDSAALVRGQDGAPLYLQGVTFDITARRRAEDENRLLAAISAALASSLDIDAALGRVAELVIPELGDVATINLTQPDGTLRRVTLQADGERGNQVRATLRSRSVRVDEDDIIARTFREGAPSCWKRSPMMTGSAMRRMTTNWPHCAPSATFRSSVSPSSPTSARSASSA